MKNIMILAVLLLIFLFSCEEQRITGRDGDCSFNKCEEGLVCKKDKCTDVIIDVPDPDFKACLIEHIKEEFKTRENTSSIDREFYKNLKEVYLYDALLQTYVDCFQHSNTDIDYSNISSIEGVQYFKNITYFQLKSKNLTSIKQLENLIDLIFIYIDAENISDISVLKNITNPVAVLIFSSVLKDISVLSNFKNLTLVSLSSPLIEDISPLKDLTKISELGISFSSTKDITPLTNLVNLENLTLYSNQISDLTPLTNLTKLKYLMLDRNLIQDVSPLSNLMNTLDDLWLQYNYIKDVSPLGSIEYIMGEKIYLHYNCIESDPPFLAQYPEICETMESWDDFLNN